MKALQFIKQAHQYQKRKTCTVCKGHKSLSEFTKKHDTKDRLRHYCKSCAKEYNDNMCPFKKWFSAKKGGAITKDIKFTLEPTDIPGVKVRRFKVRGKWTWEATQYPKVCPILKIELEWKSKRNGGQNNSPSLDRIDSTKGYIPGNVMTMSTLANRMKSNATFEIKKIEARYYLFNNK